LGIKFFLKARNNGENSNDEGTSINGIVVEMSLMDNKQTTRVARTRISMTRYAFRAWIIIFPICLLNESIPIHGSTKNRPVLLQTEGLSGGRLKPIEKGGKTIGEFRFSSRYKPEKMK